MINILKNINDIQKKYDTITGVNQPIETDVGIYYPKQIQNEQKQSDIKYDPNIDIKNIEPIDFISDSKTNKAFEQDGSILIAYYDENMYDNIEKYIDLQNVNAEYVKKSAKTKIHMTLFYINLNFSTKLSKENMEDLNKTITKSYSDNLVNKQMESIGFTKKGGLDTVDFQTDDFFKTKIEKFHKDVVKKLVDIIGDNVSTKRIKIIKDGTENSYKYYYPSFIMNDNKSIRHNAYFAIQDYYDKGKFKPHISAPKYNDNMKKEIQLKFKENQTIEKFILKFRDYNIPGKELRVVARIHGSTKPMFFNNKLKK